MNGCPIMHRAGRGGFPPFFPPPRNPVGDKFFTRELQEKWLISEGHIFAGQGVLVGRSGFNKVKKMKRK
jgi:hypothetical protein